MRMEKEHHIFTMIDELGMDKINQSISISEENKEVVDMNENTYNPIVSVCL